MKERLNYIRRENCAGNVPPHILRAVFIAIYKISFNSSLCRTYMFRKSREVLVSIEILHIMKYTMKQYSEITQHVKTKAVLRQKHVTI